MAAVILWMTLFPDSFFAVGTHLANFLFGDQTEQVEYAEAKKRAVYKYLAETDDNSSHSEKVEVHIYVHG